MTYTQEDVVMTLIQGQEGRAWAMERYGWKNDNEIFVCDWDHIECDSYKTAITKINMPEADFCGSLPSELGLLVTLQEISMSRNLIVGKIPQEIASLPHLEKVFLSQNRLTGSVPNFASYKMQTIDLANNLLSGPLHSDFGQNNQQLTQLDLASNRIIGALPASLFSSKLITISLSDNQFSGTIPNYFGNKKSLQYLYLNDNLLMGQIPSFIASGSSILKELWLENNELTGTIPPEIGEMPELFNFYIDGNKITGEVPKSLCRQELNEDFFENLNDGTKRDYCESIACPAGKVALEGVYPCDDCKESFYNPYLGRVDECIDMNEVDILKILYEATSGDNWINIEKWEINENDYCDLEGITCGNHGNIVGIELKGKGLRGSIPEEIGFLRFLGVLDLSDNYLTGYLPSDLRWAPLQYFSASGNKIKGIIPHALCRKEGINGNGKDGHFDCDFIQCSPGFHNRWGRQYGSYQCVPCRHGKGTPYIGSKKCATLSSNHKITIGHTSVNGGALFLFCLFVGMLLSMFYFSSQEERANDHTALPRTDENEDDTQKLSQTVMLT